MRYETCVFDFYGTLADIRTHEDRPELWRTMADFFRARGADYGPEQLERAYGETVRARERQCRPLFICRGDPCGRPKACTRGAVKKVCHCEPVRTLTWQSVPFLTVNLTLFPSKS